MTIRMLREGDEPALEAFLRPRLASSMFLLSNMRAAGLAPTDARYSGIYAAAFEDERITGVVGHFRNGVLIPQAPAALDALWRAAVRASERGISGLLGPDDQVGAIRAALDYDARAVQLDEREPLFSLRLSDLQLPEPLRTGVVRARRVEPRDLETLVAWRIAYEIETMHEHDTPAFRASRRERMAAAIAGRETWILESDGAPVAMSAFNARIDAAVQVGGVFTPRALRGRGYARAVVAASLLEARDGGADLAILFTGEHNAPAQRAYTALGFRPAGRFRLFFLRRPVFIER